MIRIDDRLFVRIQIGDIELPIEDMSMTHLMLAENYHLGLPEGELLIGDPILFFRNRITLTNNMRVTVSIGKNPNDLTAYRFLLFNWQETDQQATVVYRLLFILDCPLYIKSSEIQTINDTSSNALKKIAEKCSLTPVVTPTLDTQAWIPGNKTPFRWVVDIQGKGYIDSKSCMMAGVTMSHELRYSNISDIGPERVKGAKRFLRGDVGDGVTSFTLWAKKYVDKSGLSAVRGGAKMTTQEQKVTAGSQSYDKVELTRKSQYSSVSKGDLAIERSRVDVSPVGGENGHENLIGAVHQNKRLKILQSTKMYLAVLDVTNVHLFDIIYVNIIDTNNAEGRPLVNIDQSGYYVVTGKTIFISPTGQYVEKIAAIREGSNTDPQQTKDKV